MATLMIECPVCAEVLELTEEDRADLPVGEVIVCDSCHSEMEVTRNDGGEDFELELLGAMTTCPNCDEEFEVTPELLQAPRDQGLQGRGHVGISRLLAARQSAGVAPQERQMLGDGLSGGHRGTPPFLVTYGPLTRDPKKSSIPGNHKPIKGVRDL